ncbi:MAG: FecR/PupR family sigma factor regulator [Chloroflexia bacterium]|nr:FecR/PupR family sigma factor regulator [Chloroflexia bacterium]
MKDNFQEIEKLLAGYFSSDLSDDEKERVDAWRRQSPENEKTFQEILSSWDAIPLLQEMENFNPFVALNKVNTRIEHYESKRVVNFFFSVLLQY